MNKLLTFLLSLTFLFFLSGCYRAATRMANDGSYYSNVGGYKCRTHEVVIPGTIKCFNKDGEFTYYQDAMSSEEVMKEHIKKLESEIEYLEWKKRSADFWKD